MLLKSAEVLYILRLLLLPLLLLILLLLLLLLRSTLSVFLQRNQRAHFSKVYFFLRFGLA